MAKKLGVKRGTVIIQDYTSDWNSDYLQEKSILLDIFGKDCLEIEHIGSTAIPNLIAKPLIDIAIKVSDISSLNHIYKALLDTGYTERVGRLSGKQKIFAKGDDSNVTHHLHVIEQNETDWQEKIKFKNILISDPQIVIEYGELKRELFLKYHNNRSEYTRGKSQYIRNILDK